MQARPDDLDQVLVPKVAVRARRWVQDGQPAHMLVNRGGLQIEE
jgi:hypothetical protein